jgi:hypothetical protein
MVDRRDALHNLTVAADLADKFPEEAHALGVTT